MEIYSIQFNPAYTKFVCATNIGYSLFQTLNGERIPVKDAQEPKQGMHCVALLRDTPIYALVGKSVNPPWSNREVILWDSKTHHSIGQIPFRESVINVKLKDTRVVVIFNTTIKSYNMTNFHLFDHIETTTNPHGLCEITCSSSLQDVLICPDLQDGQLHVERYNPVKTLTLNAHKSALASLALSTSGQMAATASEKGTLLRVFDLVEGVQLYEFRRGLKDAEICSLAFNGKETLLACSSQMGSIHIFSLSENNIQSRLSFLSPYLPSYFSSQWSLFQYNIGPGYNQIGFQDCNCLLIVCQNGLFYKILLCNPPRIIHSSHLFVTCDDGSSC